MLHAAGSRSLRVSELVQQRDGSLPSRRQPLFHLVEHEGVCCLHRFGQRDLGLLIVLFEVLSAGWIVDTLDETRRLPEQLSHQRDFLEQEPSLKCRLSLRVDTVRAMAAVALLLQTPRR